LVGGMEFGNIFGETLVVFHEWQHNIGKLLVGLPELLVVFFECRIVVGERLFGFLQCGIQLPQLGHVDFQLGNVGLDGVELFLQCAQFMLHFLGSILFFRQPMAEFGIRILQYHNLLLCRYCCRYFVGWRHDCRYDNVAVAKNGFRGDKGNGFRGDKRQWLPRRWKNGGRLTLCIDAFGCRDWTTCVVYVCCVKMMLSRNRVGSLLTPSIEISTSVKNALLTRLGRSIDGSIYGHFRCSLSLLFVVEGGRVRRDVA